MKKISLFSILFLAILFQKCAVSKNKLNAETGAYPIIKYSDSICYSRGITVKNNFIYTANSNGKIYKYNLRSTKFKELNKETKLEELRDIAIVNKFIYGLQSGTTGKLIEISPKGETRIIEYDFWKGVFLDGMDFYNNTGFIMGDPVDNKFSLFYSKDAGKSWKKCEGVLFADKGEAGYAASGSNVQVLNDSTFIFISGGNTNRFFKSTDYGKTWGYSVIPFNSGEGIGAFSVCFKNENEAVAVGGDYQRPQISDKSAFYTLDGGQNWEGSFSGLTGYKSCVYYKNGIFYSCGTSGLDYSKDGGQNWFPLIKGNFFTMKSDNEFLYLTAPKSTVQKIKLIQ